jgi:ornithine cyclodeaminase/alanine dehydrogenase-like protein (mu-crystallin family)
VDSDATFAGPHFSCFHDLRAESIMVDASYTGADGYGVKIVCLLESNTARGLDTHQGAMLLFSGETGEALALLNASVLTELRTPAVTAVATEILAHPDSRDRCAALSVELDVPVVVIVITATNAVSPLLRHSWLRPGTHVNAIGSCVPHTRELDTATMLRPGCSSTPWSRRHTKRAWRSRTSRRPGSCTPAREETGVGTRVEY